MRYMNFAMPLAGLLKGALAAVFLLTAGCGPLISFGDEGPADDVYNLSYQGGFSADVQSASIIYLEEPLMNESLSGADIAVALSDNRRTTLQGVRWSASSADLVRDYLVRALSERAQTKFVGEGSLDVRAGCRLGLKVWAYEYVPGAAQRSDTVDIAFEFTLVRYSDNLMLGQRAFKASEAVDSSRSSGVIAGFHKGIADISERAGGWVAPLSGACALDDLS